LFAREGKTRSPEPPLALRLKEFSLSLLFLFFMPRKIEGLNLNYSPGIV